ncbi:DUF3971 domain-containing protein [Terasakiella sp. A23]|uniref:YhdP family protein n=1 Tax=Terasakiella sp. FCG-A23 TaxID=3080561 RepID=UPI002953C30C|nr:DUF3971 domain-containing protein [Terasakiella sp. A23]MDV7339421.1 DUF3971 domain-containing protein [Terasakiella sp. A23]
MLQIMLAVLSGIALLALVVAWKLSQGPISLPQLTPYIVDAISDNTRGVQIRIKDTILSWEGWERNLDIRVTGMNVFTRDGRRLASVPEAALSLSGTALIKGVVAPDTIELIRPQISLLRHGDGSLAFELGDGMTVRADRAFRLNEFVAKTPDPNHPLTYLTQIVVEKGQFEYTDNKTKSSFKAPDTDIRLERIGQTISLDTGLSIFLNGKPAKVDLNATYNVATDVLDTKTVVHKLHLSDLSYFLPELAELKAFDFSIEGTANLSIDKDANVRSFFADLKATDGLIKIPEPAQQTLDLDVLSLKMGYEDFNDQVRIEEVLIALNEGSVVRIPDPLPHFMPMESIRFSGNYETKSDQLNLENLSFDMGEGPTGGIKGSVAGLIKGPTRKVDMVGELRGVEPSKLHRYWPKGLNDDARDWVVNRIYDGIVHRAGINLSVSIPEEGEPILHHVNGDMEMEGVSVNYLPPLPPAKDAVGWAKYDHQTFKVTVTGGGVEKLRVKNAQIDILGLDEYDQRLNLDLNVSGPLRDSLQFIDRKPLEFATALGIDPKKTSGDTETNLKMSFLLLDDLTWDGVEVSAESVGKNIAITDVIFGQNLSKGEIKLDVNKKGMDVEGKIVLGTIPADLKWRENFSNETLFKRRFLLDGVVNDSQRVNELRLDFPPFNDDIMTGPVHVDATITENWDGHGELETFADLQGAKIDIPVIYWNKDENDDGQAYAKVTFNEERLIGVPYFSIASKDLKAAGALTLDATGKKLHTMKISRFQAGRTDISGGTFLHSDQSGWEGDIHGDSLDLSALLFKVRNTDRTKEEPTNEDTDLFGTFSGRFGKIWLDDKHSLDTVAGAVSSNGKIWTQAHLTGVVGGGQPFMIDLSPDGVNRRLTMETKDAGALLRSLDLFDDMQDGELLIEGILNDQVVGRPLVGTIQVDNYRITKVPALAKVLSLVGITGVIDSLQGEGLGFLSLTSPFKYNNGVIELKEGRTNGVSIGLTWEGKLYTHANAAQVRGTVVPAYSLNSLLGNVPILGNLFSGGEKGGGLFAWTYQVTGSLDDPDVSVNPVSALAPGFLRRLFQLGDGDQPPPKVKPVEN